VISLLKIHLILCRGNLYYKKLTDEGCKIEIKKIYESRTVTQNAYLHVCINIFAIEFGSTMNEAKIDLKRVCNFMTYEKNGNKYLKETRGLNTKELAEFIEWIRTYSAQQNCYIPTADEYKQQSFEIDKHIDNHKEYL